MRGLPPHSDYARSVGMGTCRARAHLDVGDQRGLRTSHKIDHDKRLRDDTGGSVGTREESRRRKMWMMDELDLARFKRGLPSETRDVWKSQSGRGVNSRCYNKGSAPGSPQPEG